MAVNLLGASNARIDYGDIAALSGATALTVAITFNASSFAGANRIFHQWGSGAASGCFILGTADTDEVSLIARNINFYGKKTTALNMATGTTYRVCAKLNWTANQGEIWVNGASQSVAESAGSTNIGTLPNVATSVQIGHETAETLDGIDADYSEAALWTEYVPSGFCEAYSKGYSPLFYRRNLILYAPLLNTSHLRDVARGAAGTNVAGTNATHPSMLYPRRVG